MTKYKKEFKSPLLFRYLEIEKPNTNSKNLDTNIINYTNKFEDEPRPEPTKKTPYGD